MMLQKLKTDSPDVRRLGHRPHRRRGHGPTARGDRPTRTGRKKLRRSRSGQICPRNLSKRQPRTAVRPEARPSRRPRARRTCTASSSTTARGSYLASAEEVRAGRGSLLRVYLASRQLLDAQRDAAKTPEEKARAVEEHIDRIRTLESRFELGSTDRAEAAAILAEAQLWLAQAKEARKETPKPEGSPVEPRPGTGPGSKPGKDARSLAVLAKLEEPVAMSFPNETPLEDVAQVHQAGRRRGPMTRESRSTSIRRAFRRPTRP